MNHLKTIATSFICVAAILIQLVAVAIALPPIRGVDVAIVGGESMKPTYVSGQIVLLRKQSSYQEGDVVRFQTRNMDSPWFHRLVKQTGDGKWFTIGDQQAMAVPENPQNYFDLEVISNGDITGEAVYASPQFWGAVGVLDAGVFMQVMMILMIVLIVVLIWMTRVVLSRQPLSLPENA